MGTASVPGKGSGEVDKVPAMLAPGEAVLNHHAAEIIGRDKIAAANAIGNHIAKGMMPAKPKAEAKGPQPQKLSGGTHMVGHGKSAPTPAKIDPAHALALLQSLKAGGGMPAPGGGMPGMSPAPAL